MPSVPLWKIVIKRDHAGGIEGELPPIDEANLQCHIEEMLNQQKSPTPAPVEIAQRIASGFSPFRWDWVDNKQYP